MGELRWRGAGGGGGLPCNPHEHTKILMCLPLCLWVQGESSMIMRERYVIAVEKLRREWDAAGRTWPSVPLLTPPSGTTAAMWSLGSGMTQ